MTLAASGAITLVDIRNEFKAASGAVSLSEMYRSGTYVPPLTANAGIPTSGQIQLDDFYSTTVVTDMDASYSAESIGIKGGGSTVSFTVGNDGNIASICIPSIVTNFSDTWVASSSAPGSWYEVYVSVSSGTSPTGASLNTWLALSSDRTWTLSSSASCTLTLKIRHKYNTASEETCTIYLTAGA
jgi:hypothetical protein